MFHSKSRKWEFQLGTTKIGGLYNIAFVVLGIVTKEKRTKKHRQEIPGGAAIRLLIDNFLLSVYNA